MRYVMSLDLCDIMGSGEQCTLNCAAGHVHKTMLSVSFSMSSDCTIEVHLG